jgi:hypothetical protein
MTKTKIKETLFNKLGWRLSDREEEIMEKALQSKELELHGKRLSEREEYIIKVARGVFAGE